MELFDENACEVLRWPDAEWLYWPRFLSAAEADAVFMQLRDELLWRQDELHIGGRTIPIPRLNAWYADAGRGYTYSGIRMEPLPWTETLAGLRARVETACAARFNSVLCNFYRDGRDSVAWHADDEPELGREPQIASLSLGAERTFELRHRRARELGLRTQHLHLLGGSLLLMRGATQRCWLHRLPKEPGITRGRINLTFRQVL